MKRELDLVTEFHKKFKVPVLDKPSLIPEDRLTHRHKLMKDEVEEYLKGAQSGDLENVAKELADILYAVYGTILEHGLQNIIGDVFGEVNRSNMSKDYHEYKMVKGQTYSPPDLKKFLGQKP